MCDNTFLDFVSNEYDDDIDNVDYVDTSIPSFRSYYSGGDLYIPYLPELREVVISDTIRRVIVDDRNDCYINNPDDVPVSYV